MTKYFCLQVLSPWVYTYVIKKKQKKKQLFRDYRRTSEYFVEVNLYQGMRSQLTITKQNQGTQKTNVYKPTQQQKQKKIKNQAHLRLNLIKKQSTSIFITEQEVQCIEFKLINSTYKVILPFIQQIKITCGNMNYWFTHKLGNHSSKQAVIVCILISSSIIILRCKFNMCYCQCSKC